MSKRLAPKITLLFALVIVSSCLLLMACSDDSSTQLDDVTLCDGSDDLRLAYTIKSKLGRVPPGEQVMIENGHEFLFVDGQCRYWVFPKEDNGTSDDMWRDVVTGELTATQEESLKEDFAVRQWQRWDQQQFQEPGLFDGSIETFWIPSAAFQCSGDCGSKLRRQIRSSLHEWMRTLAEEGEVVDGPLRAAAVVMPDSMVRQDRPHPIQPAPAGLDLEAHAVSFGDAYQVCYGDGFVVSGDAVDVLRQYREEYRSGTHGDFWYRYLPIEDEQGTVFMVYVRDSTSLENANGLVELEGIPDGTCPEP